ncbi:MAG: hypothetical protein JO287_27500 [Pseudonocardiales bacterium]|nr:hypothetical protein [Pseudonocardiales bacterium]
MVSKQLTCPDCDDVVADVVYRPWAGRLTVSSTEGDPIMPSRWAIQMRLAEQDLAAAAADSVAPAQARLDFLKSHIGELIYDIRCRRGHSTLRTGPQIIRALRRTPGRWVSLR